MWLRLYQSASIWLVWGLSRAPTHRATVPQVQIPLRPIASSAAATAVRIAKARNQVRRDMGARLSRGASLAKIGRRGELRAYAAHLRTRLRREHHRGESR